MLPPEGNCQVVVRRCKAFRSSVVGVALLCAAACNQGEPAPPVPGIPVNCDAYDGLRIGSWRGVPYPEGVLIDSAGVTENEFFLLGGDYCFYCQENWLPTGADEWISRPLDDAAVRSQISDATPSHVVATDDYIGTSEISNWDRDLVLANKFIFLERSEDTWEVFDPPSEYGVRWHTSLYWTGREFLLWGGFRSETYPPEEDTPVLDCTDGALFDPEARSWRVTSAARTAADFPYAEIEAHAHLSSVWTPEGLLVWGATGEDDTPLLARYEIDEDSWEMLDASDGPSPRLLPQLVYGDGHVYVLSGEVPDVGEGREPLWDLWRLDLDTLNWEQIEVPAFVDLYDDSRGALAPTAAWVDGRLMVAGPVCVGVSIYDPATDSWVRSTVQGAPPASGTARSVAGELYLNAVSYSLSTPTETVWIFDPGG